MYLSVFQFFSEEMLSGKDEIQQQDGFGIMSARKGENLI